MSSAWGSRTRTAATRAGGVASRSRLAARAAWTTRVASIGRSDGTVRAARESVSAIPSPNQPSAPPAVTFWYGRISTGRGLTAAAASPGRSPAGQLADLPEHDLVRPQLAILLRVWGHGPHDLGADELPVLPLREPGQVHALPARRERAAGAAGGGLGHPPHDPALVRVD